MEAESQTGKMGPVIPKKRGVRHQGNHGWTWVGKSLGNHGQDGDHGHHGHAQRYPEEWSVQLGSLEENIWA